MTIDEAAVQRLLDREAIRDALIRYSRGIDRHDVEIIVSAYHPDAVDTHGQWEGGPEALAEWGNRAHAQNWLAHNHFLGNTTFDFSGDTCHTETYVLDVQRRNDDTGNDVLGGRYIDRFERRDGEWRIARRVLLLDWTGEMSADRSRAQDLLERYDTGRWDRDDLSYRRPLE
jgi:ketosteroid isomerase-like protein